ncbi:MAG: hypothetical protein AAF391_05665 [Bacteroidota bacterium]
MKRLFTLLCIILLSGCEQKPTNHPVFKYYPPEEVFEDGYVSKYYYHYYPDNPDRRAATEIRYTKYIKTSDTNFRTENFNAGFELVSERYYIVDGDSIVIERGSGIDRSDPTDTVDLNVLSNTLSVWRGEMSNPYQVQYTYGDKEYIYTEDQHAVTDTTILDKPAKVFANSWNYREVGSDSLFNEGTSKSYYVQELGFFGSDNKGSDYSQQVELVEQMSVEEFDKRADHGQYRVAYIDPNESISDDTNFALCDHIINVADYYNSTPDGRYIHGKRAMLDSIYANLDKSKLFDQNGSLVFRFVVNCEGKAGRFIAEGYDVSYQPMEFETETIEHLLGLLQRLEDWRPVVIREEANDAYFYINFKIENGEIIDILP